MRFSRILCVVFCEINNRAIETAINNSLVFVGNVDSVEKRDLFRTEFKCSQNKLPIHSTDSYKKTLFRINPQGFCSFIPSN